MSNLTEKQIEDVFEIFHSDLIEKNLKLISRQHIFDNRLRADLLFKDKNNVTVVVELKRSAITREDIGQLLEYHGMFDKPNTRIILAAPFIPEAIRKSFEHFGIEYIQFSKSEIEKLFHKIKDRPKIEQQNNTIEFPETVLTHPLSEKIIDGNIAFKVTFNDNEWINVCSKDIADYNFKNRTWCKIQSTYEDNCQNPKWTKLIEEDKGIVPCADCVALRYLEFYPGHFHGEKHNNEPKRCLGAKMGKIALFTSKEPGANESERFIFAIGQINRIETLKEAGYETIGCNDETAVYIKNNDLKLWKYFRNKNTDRIAWNTGLFRYINDKVVSDVLNGVINEGKYDKAEVDRAKKLLTFM
ncbi:MAG: hypothetical protein ACJAWV_000161 [Flammeovirgaceae bacterium]|jgi:hypothetical protein